MRKHIVIIITFLTLQVSNGQEPRIKTGDTICFIGDSITAMGTGRPYGYVQLAVAGMKANGLDFEWSSSAGGGKTSRGVVEHFMDSVIAKKPDFVTIVIGVNDVGHQKVAADGTVTAGTNGVLLPEFKRNYRHFTQRFTEAGIQVLILTPTPHGEPTDSERDIRLVPYVEFLRTFAMEKGYPLIDLHKIMRQEIVTRSQATGEAPRFLVTSDTLHMNPIGDIIMAKAILRAYGLSDSQIAQAEIHWLSELNPDVPDDAIRLPVSTALKFEKLPLAKQQEIKDRFAEMMKSKVAKASANPEQLFIK
jgi:lysophospholipase L1-like esterase